MPLDWPKFRHLRPACQLTFTSLFSACAVQICEVKTSTRVQGLLKSMLYFTSCPLRIIIFTDKVKKTFAKFGKLTTAPLFKNAKATLEIRPVVYPLFLKENRTMWQSWGPCLTLRLFFASVLPGVDAIIHMDSDVFAVAPVEDFWKIFKAMNATQFMAVSAESDRGSHWYGRVAKTPYVGASGLNAGVIPMNLTRLRAFDWEGKILAAYEKYKDDLLLIDQDLINIVLHNYPEGLMDLSPEWNFRHLLCPHAVEKTPFLVDVPPNVTAKMLHGDSSGVRDGENWYHYPYFKAIQQLDTKQKMKNFKKQIVEPVGELMRLPFRFQGDPCRALGEDLLRSIEKLNLITRA